MLEKSYSLEISAIITGRMEYSGEYGATSVAIVRVQAGDKDKEEDEAEPL